MLSILIPTYNFDCSQLVADLDASCAALEKKPGEKFRYEIIVSDDASQEFPDNLLRTCKAMSHCTLLQQKENQGRAHNCNAMIHRAKYEYILIVDADAKVCTQDFIETYWKHRDEAKVICGSLQNPEEINLPGHELRLLYERAAESRRPAEVRRRNPYACFTTFNVMFRKEVLQDTAFDERCLSYGYEDTLMGLKLKERDVSVCHIDNPLIHTGIDSNESFLNKTETALRSLLHLGDPLQSEVGASRAYQLLRRCRLEKIWAVIFLSIQRPLRKNLLGHHPSLLLYNLYRSGFYAALAEGKIK